MVAVSVAVGCTALTYHDSTNEHLKGERKVKYGLI